MLIEIKIRPRLFGTKSRLMLREVETESNPHRAVREQARAMLRRLKKHVRKSDMEGCDKDDEVGAIKVGIQQLAGLATES